MVQVLLRYWKDGNSKSLYERILVKCHSRKPPKAERRESYIKECSTLDKETKEHNDREVICGVHNG